MSKRQRLPIDLEPDVINVLDELASDAGITRTQVIRDLIPPIEVVRAMEVCGSFDGPGRQTACRLFMQSHVLQWRGIITSPQIDRNLAVQHQVLCVGADLVAVTARLYRKWLAASRDERGFGFRMVTTSKFSGDPAGEVWLCYGPNDTKGDRELLARQMVFTVEQSDKATAELLAKFGPDGKK